MRETSLRTFPPLSDYLLDSRDQFVPARCLASHFYADVAAPCLFYTLDFDTKCVWLYLFLFLGVGCTLNRLFQKRFAFRAPVDSLLLHWFGRRFHHLLPSLRGLCPASIDAGPQLLHRWLGAAGSWGLVVGTLILSPSAVADVASACFSA